MSYIYKPNLNPPERMSAWGWELLGITVCAFVMFALIISWGVTSNEEQTIETERNGMCLQGIYPPNEVIINESQAGEYHYEILATSKGIEVWVQCGKI